jgi:hypothetical protein
VPTVSEENATPRPPSAASDEGVEIYPPIERKTYTDGSGRTYDSEELKNLVTSLYFSDKFPGSFSGVQVIEKL